MVRSDSALSDKDCNYIKSISAVRLFGEGIEPLVAKGSLDYSEEILNEARKEAGCFGNEICGLCTTRNALPCTSRNGVCHFDKDGNCRFHDENDPLKASRPCPKGICDKVFGIMKRRHRFHLPNFKNTDARKWFELMKCFISTDGYLDNETVEKTDCAGLLSIIINCKSFQSMVDADLGPKDNPFAKMREVRNKIFHSAGMFVSDKDFQEYIILMLSILSDSGFLANDEDAQDAAEKIQEISDSSVHVFCGEEQNTEDRDIDGNVNENNLSLIARMVCQVVPFRPDYLAVFERDDGEGRRTLTQVFKERTDQLNDRDTLVNNNALQGESQKKTKPAIVIVFSVKKKYEDKSRSMSRDFDQMTSGRDNSDRKGIGVQSRPCVIPASNNYRKLVKESVSD